MKTLYEFIANAEEKLEEFRKDYLELNKSDPKSYPCEGEAGRFWEDFIIYVDQAVPKDNTSIGAILEIKQSSLDIEAVKIFSSIDRILWAVVHQDIFRNNLDHDFCDRLDAGETITVQISEVKT
jgi:hypothetical protein